MIESLKSVPMDIFIRLTVKTGWYSSDERGSVSAASVIVSFGVVRALGFFRSLSPLLVTFWTKERLRLDGFWVLTRVIEHM
jgi:hypothetical protein